MKVKTLLSNERKWVQGEYEYRGRYCLLGALQKCYGKQVGITPIGKEGAAYRVAKKKIEAAIKEFSKNSRVKLAGKPNIIRFNDNARTTFKDIRKVVRAANV